MKGVVSALAIVIFVAMGTNSHASSLTSFDDLQYSWQHNWTDSEKNKYYYQLSMQFLDLVSTGVLKNRTGEEANSLFGKNFSNEEFMGAKLAGNLLMFTLTNDAPKGSRNTVLNILNVVMTIVVVNNFDIAGGERRPVRVSFIFSF